MFRQARLNWYASRDRRNKQSPNVSPNRLRRILRYEPLEDRRMLAITVDTLVDEADGSIVDGDVSLRDAIAMALPGEAINFSVSGTITLTMGDLGIDKDVSIEGPRADLLTIDASGNDPTPVQNEGNGSRIFRIMPGVSAAPDVNISGVTLTGGDADALGGGAILADNGTLSISNSILRDNSTTLNGGAVAMVAGELTISGSELSNNHAGVRGGAIATSAVATIANSQILSNTAQVSGGGIESVTSMTIQNSTVAHNTATQDGGGIVTLGGTLDIESSIIDDNHASGGKGGGAYVAASTFDITDSTFSANTASTTGGGVDMPTGSLNILDSIFSQNMAGQAGGGMSTTANTFIHGSQILSNSAATDGGGINATNELELLNTEVHDNSATRNGGGLYWNHAGDEDLTISNSSFTSNKALGGSGGGGVWSFSNGSGISSVSVRNSLIANNESAFAGGIRLDTGVNSGSGLITNTTISGNVASGHAGGIFSAAASAGNVISSSTITGNSAPLGGGGLLWTGSVLVHATILAGNIGDTPDIEPVAFNDVFRFFPSFSLIGNNSVSAGFEQVVPEAPVGSPDSNGNLVGGPANGVIDAQLLPLANNGGPTLTHAFSPLSPAFNAGGTVGSGFDQRGFPFSRVAFGARDIGAFEFSVDSPSVTLVVDTALDEFDADLGPGDLSLREALWLANLANDTQSITFSPTLSGQTVLLTLGELQITSDINIDGLGSGLLTIDASGNDPNPALVEGNGSRIFRIVPGVSAAPDVQITSVTLTGGDADSLGGGAILADNGQLSISDSILSDNATTLNGGAVAMVAGELTVSGSELSNNHAGLRGGAIATSAAGTILDSHILNNTALDSGGGIESVSSMSVSNSIIALNTTAGIGGGILTLGGEFDSRRFPN